MIIGDTMKKKYMIGIGVTVFILLLITLIIVFKSRKNMVSLHCILTENQTGTSSTSQIDLTFKSNQLTKAKSDTEVVLTSDLYKGNIDLVYNALQEQYSDAKKEKGVIVKSQKKENSISIELVVDALKNPEQVKIIGSSITNEINYEEAKKTLEDFNYVCE